MKTLKQLSEEEQIEARIVRVNRVRDAVLVIAFAFAGYMLWRMAVRQ